MIQNTPQQQLLDAISEAQLAALINNEDLGIFSGLLKTTLQLVDCDFGLIGEVAYTEKGILFFLVLLTTKGFRIL
jgi:hypothetical protein